MIKIYTSEDFKELKEKIEEKQGVKLNEFKQRNNKTYFDTYPILTREELDNGVDENLPCIIFRIENNRFKLMQVYLLKQNMGTGTIIIDWIIEFCHKNNLKGFEVLAIESLYMEKICKDKNMQKRFRDTWKEDEFDYIIEFR